MKIGIISDTHDNIKATKKAVSIFKQKNIHTLFHLGDFIAPFTLKIFNDFNLYGVFGNNDGEKILLMNVAKEHNFNLSNPPLELTLNSKNFLLIHGWGSAEKTRRLIYFLAKSENYDFILYGHTHQRDLRKIGKTTIINPGEACGYLTGKKSIAIVDIENSDVKFIVFD